MLRRAAMLLPLAICLAADPARDSADVITGLAAALTAGNDQEFMAPFDRGMTGYNQLQANVRALILQAETQSYLDIAVNEGDEKARRLEILWTLRTQRTGDPTAQPERTERLHCRMEMQGKRWRIVAFDGAGFFAL
jgi:hypothetical protein